jgi:hypothetical protein
MMIVLDGLAAAAAAKQLLPISLFLSWLVVKIVVGRHQRKYSNGNTEEILEMSEAAD